MQFRRIESIELAKLLVFKMGHRFGFTHPLMAGIAGCLLLFLAFLVIPGSLDVLFNLPVISDLIARGGITREHAKWCEWCFEALGTYLSLCCWCRVAVLCHPRTFDRYRINTIIQ